MGEGRGPCEQCKHFRKGGSVALAAFKALPDGGRLKVMLQTTANQRRQEESAQAGSLIEERRTARQTETDEYLRRPTIPNFGYCGVDEFVRPILLLGGKEQRGILNTRANNSRSSPKTIGFRTRARHARTTTGRRTG